MVLLAVNRHFINVYFICNGAREGACSYPGKSKLSADKILADWQQNTKLSPLLALCYTL